MPYLNPANYWKIISPKHIGQLTDDDLTLLDETEQVGIAEMKSYLCGRFDVDVLFAAGATGAYPQIAMYLTDIVIYHLSARLSPGRNPEVREQRYARATAWLTMVREGELCPDFPPKPNPQNPNGEEDASGSVFTIISAYERKNYRY